MTSTTNQNKKTKPAAIILKATSFGCQQSNLVAQDRNGATKNFSREHGKVKVPKNCMACKKHWVCSQHKSTQNVHAFWVTLKINDIPPNVEQLREMLWILCYPQPCDALDRIFKKNQRRLRKNTNRSNGVEGKTGCGRKKQMDVGGKKYRSDVEVGMENMISLGKTHHLPGKKLCW